MSNEIRLLHVDEDAAFLDITAVLLEKVADDITVSGESDPTKALDLIDVSGFECVISDHNTPQIDGIELCDQLREKYPKLPFFVFTGQPTESLVDDALAVGVTDIIHKEPGISHYKLLANRLRNAVRHYRIRQSIYEESDIP